MALNVHHCNSEQYESVRSFGINYTAHAAINDKYTKFERNLSVNIGTQSTFFTH